MFPRTPKPTHAGAALDPGATQVDPGGTPVQEERCPGCGQPMLRAWGATCGICRQPLGYARLSSLLEAGRRGQPTLAIAWLAVAASPDPTREARVFQIEHAATVLTREDAAAGRPGELRFRDDFMSAGHAVLARVVANREVRFTLQDRKQPGPSANGTFLNQRRLEDSETADLCDGDEVRVGSTELVFRTLVLPGRS